ncbi:hypothetical protein Hypma_014605, partial [Hypsizygus marmoreus]
KSRVRGSDSFLRYDRGIRGFRLEICRERKGCCPSPQSHPWLRRGLVQYNPVHAPTPWFDVYSHGMLRSKGLDRSPSI